MRPELCLCSQSACHLMFMSPGKGGNLEHIVGPYYTGGGPLKTLLPSGTAIATNLVSVVRQLAALYTTHTSCKCACIVVQLAWLALLTCGALVEFASWYSTYARPCSSCEIVLYLVCRTVAKACT